MQQNPTESRSRKTMGQQQADLVTGKIRALLLQGAYAESVHTLQMFLDQHKKPKSPFRGFRKLADVPLALALQDSDLLALLEDEGIRNVGHLKQRSDEMLLDITGIRRPRLKLIREAEDRLTKDYLAWRLRKKRE